MLVLFLLYIYFIQFYQHIMRGVSMKKSCIYLENCKREMKTNKHLPAKNDLNHKLNAYGHFWGIKCYSNFFIEVDFAKRRPSSGPSILQVLLRFL